MQRNIPKEDIASYVKDRIGSNGKKQLEEFYQHINKHSQELQARGTPVAIRDYLTYKITPSTIGYIYVASCNVCKKEVDLTDYSHW